MINKLKPLVEKIYQDYAPLNNLDKSLLQRNPEQSFRRFLEKHGKDLSEKEFKRLEDELFDWGPLVDLIDQDDIFDILIQGPDHIYVESSKGLSKWPDQFLSQRSFDNFKELLLKESKLLINQRDPFGNGKARGFRVHIVTPPISKQTTITLRKHRKYRLSFEKLFETGFCNPDEKELIQNILNSHKNFLVVGPTGSGKTTFLNSLIGELPEHERLVVIEDTDEIQSGNPLHAKLLAREICPETLKPVLMEDLVKQSLRMRPDRLVVGEVRGQEAKDLLQALATGHTGSMGTLHAHSARQALLRLEMLIQMGAPQWSLHSIRQLINMSLDYLIVLSNDRMNKGIKEISKIAGVEEFGILLEDQKKVPGTHSIGTRYLVR